MNLTDLNVVSSSISEQVMWFENYNLQYSKMKTSFCAVYWSNFIHLFAHILMYVLHILHRFHSNLKSFISIFFPMNLFLHNVFSKVHIPYECKHKSTGCIYDFWTRRWELFWNALIRVSLRFAEYLIFPIFKNITLYALPSISLSNNAIIFNVWHMAFAHKADLAL